VLAARGLRAGLVDAGEAASGEALNSIPRGLPARAGVAL